MNKQKLWLKTALWLGIVADLVLGAIMMFFHELVELIWGIQMNNIAIVWCSYFGLVVFSWSFILLWTIRKPFERKIIALITAFPAVSGMIVIELLALINGIFPVSTLLLLLIVFQLCLVILFTFSYYTAKKSENH